MATTRRPSRRSAGSALRNTVLVQFTVAYFLAIMAEWAFFGGALVYAYDRGGSRAAGLASVVLLLPTAIVGPAAGAAAQRRPDHVRRWSFATQAVALGSASIAAFAGAPVAVVVACCAVAAAAFTFLGPVCGVLLPAIVRSARELTVANVWIGACESAGLLVGAALSTVLLTVQGAALVLAGGAVLTSVSTAMMVLQGRVVSSPGGQPDVARTPGSTRLMLHCLKLLRERPGAGGVLAIAGGHYVLVGSLDLIVVVLAID